MTAAGALGFSGVYLLPASCAKDSNLSHGSITPPITSVPFGVTYEKIGTIQRRLAWPLHKDDTLLQSGRPTGLNIYFVLSVYHASLAHWISCRRKYRRIQTFLDSRPLPQFGSGGRGTRLTDFYWSTMPAITADVSEYGIRIVYIDYRSYGN